MLNQSIKLKSDKWLTWGFKSNPFDHCALQANNYGASLLVGRNNELQQTIDSLTEPKKITVLNGGIGVGKTSLANVAIYYLQELSKQEENAKLYICCEKNIEFSHDDTIIELEFNIYTEVAKAIVNFKKGNSADAWRTLDYFDEISALLNDPLFESKSINIAAIGGFEMSSSPNSSDAFGKSGFISIIKSWVRTYFPHPGNGFFLCVIDNFELMDEASKIFEILRKNRDRLFDVHGLKYVICGANNSTLRLEDQWLASFLDERIDIPNLSMNYAREIYATRVEYHKARDDFYIPLTENSFVALANTIKCNVRDLLGEAEKYCAYAHRKSLIPTDKDQKESNFNDWLDQQTQNILSLIKSEMTKNCWTILINASSPAFDGIFTSSDHAELSVAQGSYSNSLSRLKELGLVTEEVDESHRKKKNYKLTPKAYYALHARHNPALSLTSIMEDSMDVEDADTSRQSS